MTAIRADVDAALRALPEVRALRKAAVREGEQYTTILDRIACSPFAPSLRVVVLVDVAYRALMAASSVIATARVPEPAARAVSTRPAAARSLLALAGQWRDRCPGCGQPFGPSVRSGRCVPGRCVPVTGWEPRITPGLDGAGEWDG